MSFILDALRRAETRREAQAAPRVEPESALQGIADEPSKMPSLRWIAILVVAAIAVAVLAMNLPIGRNSAGTMTANTRQAAPAQAPSFPAIASDTPLAEVATPAAREVRPLLREAQPSRKAGSALPLTTGGTVTYSQEQLSATEAVTPAGSAPPRATGGTVTYSQEQLSGNEPGSRTLTNVPDDAPRRDVSLPSYAETVMSGGGQFPEFHLDIHVYAADPARRFVFVNNRKYREGQQLDEGGTVERITPAGVVLNHRGRRFELLPD